MRRAVIITGAGFEDTEVFYPFYRLQEAEYVVDICTADDQEAKGKYGIPAKPTIKCIDLDANQYDLAVIPGGHEAPDRVRQVPAVLHFIKTMNDQRKAIASICHGPWVLASAKILSGRRVTCYKGCRDDIRNAGAEWVDECVVVDGNIVTAQHFRDNGAWMRAVLKFINN